MTGRELLHEAVDKLADEDVITALRILKGLELAPDPLRIALDAALDDDEADDDDFDGGLTEARKDAEASRTIPHEQVKRKLHLDE